MTVDVESMLAPDGRPSVGLTVPTSRSWWKRGSTTTVYLGQDEARRLAGSILEASGVVFSTVLEEESKRLAKALEAPGLDRDQAAHLRMCQAVVKLLQRVLVP
jgi:hypothetical protein